MQMIPVHCNAREFCPLQGLLGFIYRKYDPKHFILLPHKIITKFSFELVLASYSFPHK